MINLDLDLFGICTEGRKGKKAKLLSPGVVPQTERPGHTHLGHAGLGNTLDLLKLHQAIRTSEKKNCWSSKLNTELKEQFCSPELLGFGTVGQLSYRQSKGPGACIHIHSHPLAENMKS